MPTTLVHYLLTVIIHTVSEIFILKYKMPAYKYLHLDIDRDPGGWHVMVISNISVGRLLISFYSVFEHFMMEKEVMCHEEA